MKKTILSPPDHAKRNYLTLLLRGGLVLSIVPGCLTLSMILASFMPLTDSTTLSLQVTLWGVTILTLLFCLVGGIIALFQLNRALWRQALPEASNAAITEKAICAVLPVGNWIIPVLLAHVQARRQSDPVLRRWTIFMAWAALLLPFGVLAADLYLGMFAILFLAALSWLAAYGLLTLNGIRQWRENGVAVSPGSPGRKRFAWFVGGAEIAILLVTFGIWAVFAWYAPHTLETVQQNLATHDIPLTPEEMFRKYPATTDADAEYLSKLFANTTTFPPALAAFMIRPSYGASLPPEIFDVLLPYVLQQTERIQLLEELPKRTGLRFRRDWKQGASVLLPELSQARVLAYFEDYRILNAVQHHDRAQVLRIWEEEAAVRRLLNTEPILISKLVAIAIGKVQLASLEAVLPQLDFSDAELRQIQDMLLEEEKSMLPVYSTFIDGEFNMMNVAFSILRQGNNDIFRFVDLNEPSPMVDTLKRIVPNVFPFKQLLDLNEANYNLDLLARKKLFTDEAYVAGDAVRALNNQDRGSLTTLGSALLLPALEKSYFVINEYLASVRCARTVIAAELYHRRHGQWPEKAADLVPEFLPEVPLDPFDGQPLRFTAGDLLFDRAVYEKNRPDYIDTHYETATHPGFRVYSVGEDGKDNHGEPRRAGAGRSSEKSEYDITFSLYDGI